MTSPSLPKVEDVRHDDKNVKSLWPVARLGLRPPLRRRLEAAGINTIGDLLRRSPARLASELRLEPSAIASIAELLEYLDLTFDGSFEVADGCATEARSDINAAQQKVNEAKLPVTFGGNELLEAADHSSTGQMKKRHHPTENERAMKFAREHSDQKSIALTRKRRGPDLSRAEDRRRIVDLYNSLTFEVVDAAWLYGISRGAAYSACRDGKIVTKILDDRFKVISALVFEELFTEIPTWLAESAQPPLEALGD